MMKKSVCMIASMVGLLFLLFMGCSKTMTYEDVLAEELAKDVRYDSLFYGIHFNMTSPAFLDHCFEMNQKKIFFQYGTGSEVIVKFDEEFKFPVEFKFFPNLEKHLIQELQGRFLYIGRSPFNTERGSDVLILDVVRQMEEWYEGRKFIKISPVDKWLTDKYVKIDGNRRITLEQNLVTGEVQVLFEDLKRIL